MTQEGTPPDRTELAKFRTSLALDRTTLAWIRTTLTMATFGFGMIGFFRALNEKAQNEKIPSSPPRGHPFWHCACRVGIARDCSLGRVPLGESAQGSAK